LRCGLNPPDAIFVHQLNTNETRWQGKNKGDALYFSTYYAGKFKAPLSAYKRNQHVGQQGIPEMAVI
jgi:hypothetical protein